MTRPCIGVTGPDRGGLAAWLFTSSLVRLAGGRPVRIRPKRPVDGGRLDGLIIGGGADVSPALYGQHRHVPVRELADRGAAGWRRAIGYVLFPLLWLLRRLLTKKRGGLDPARDELENRLIEHALEHELPMLGICRGMQLVNVALGGSLHQSLDGFYDEYPEIRSVLPRKRVELEPGSRLRAVLGVEACRVNALHRQAIDRPGRGLVAVAREPSGVIQGFEAESRWLIGVQWHPEYLPQRAEQRALFRALVAKARREPGR
ncbi:MAG: gamma-glutamyl-gamma-aminobutyrate hydrolase family protein [Wenzhouxiangellaceae bacterium]|nr:gamma-glutamyl-gamma-aminobutyrate hydrolase family protein [Wenzhouxiangellaceae bacterium]